jgi:hypothetical protein
VGIVARSVRFQHLGNSEPLFIPAHAGLTQGVEAKVRPRRSLAH